MQARTGHSPRHRRLPIRPALAPFCLMALLIGAPLFAQANPLPGPGTAGGPPPFGGPQAGGGPLKLEWNKVAGAGGYVVEIQDENGQTRLRRQTEQNEINFGLPVGEYRQRIGVLNKFKKVSVWSNWRPLIIKRPGDPIITSISPARVALGRDGQSFEIRGENIYSGSKVSIVRDGVQVPFRTRDARTGEINLRLNTTTIEPGAYAVVVENPDGRRARSTTDLQIVRAGRDGQPLDDAERWKKLVPGLHQMSNGATLKGAAWMTVFGGLAVAGAASAVVGNQAAAATAGDPLYNLMFNPLVLYAARDSFGSRQQALTVAALAYDRVLANQSVYQTAANVQAGVGAAAGLLYVLNYVDASDWDFATAVPGAKTPAWRSVLYWTLLGGLAAGSVNEYQAAEEAVRTAGSDPLIQAYTNPIWSVALLSNQTRNDQNLALAALADQRDSDLGTRHELHRQNQLAFGAAAGLIYFGHFLDLTFSDAGLTMEVQYVPAGLFAASNTGVRPGGSPAGVAGEGFTGLQLRFVF